MKSIILEFCTSYGDILLHCPKNYATSTDMDEVAQKNIIQNIVINISMEHLNIVSNVQAAVCVNSKVQWSGYMLFLHGNLTKQSFNTRYDLLYHSSRNSRNS